MPESNHNKDLYTNIEYIQRDMRDLNKSVSDVHKKLDKHYVTYSEFRPVKIIAYGIVGITMATVLGAVIAGVVDEARATKQQVSTTTKDDL